MTERKILFRGFHLNKKGNTVIRLNGKEIKGEWLYWEVHGMLVNKQTKIAPLTYVKLIFNFELVEETIGQWVATDKNGKDVFEEDIVKFRAKDGRIYTGTIKYDNIDCSFKIIYNEFLCFGCLDYQEKLSTYDFELIGNKWGVTE